jgi:hypothetical protein
MANKIRLTQSAVAAAGCPPGRKDVLIFDRDLSGFALRVTATGGKSFLAQFRSPAGQVRRLPLGRFGTITPEQARRSAVRELGRVAAGDDPVAIRRAEQVARAAEAS